MKFCLLSLCVVYSLPAVSAADEGTDTARPIQALLVTGGCCHDYHRQKLILTRGISARANVRWTVVHQGGSTTDTKIPLYHDPDWADGFDIVVHNECFAGVKDPEFVDRILKPHREGTPAILIHCAMHCYRVGDDRWFRFVGVQSPGHGPHYSYTADNLNPDHPVMKGFGPKFVAPKGELYHSVKVFDTATPLAQANRQSDGIPQVCVWTNNYEGTRVFGCTMGHYNETMAEPKYLDMMARAVLWAVGRDPERDFTPSTETIDNDIRSLVSAPLQKGDTRRLPGNCCGDANLAFGKPVTSKTEQQGNFRKHLTDGRLDTRWCASGSQPEEWVTVDLEQPQHVRAIRLHWEARKDIVYRYIVEASADNETWTKVVDASNNDKPGGILAHTIDSPDTRYLRTTFLGASRGLWGSIWELEVSSGELPELADVAPPPDSSSASISDVQAPLEFNVTLFGQPPDVNYPVCLTAAASGEVFVGVDEQGSLGKEPGRGKVLRCIDTDGDGAADRINVFAKMDHPRGLIYNHGSLWVLHPPFLTVFRDTDGDGTSDQSEVLIEGISTDEVNKRGADHTTNGIRMGIDGWIYIAVGDFGFTNAVAKDGTTLSKRGGGIVRIRPDGTEMEIFSWGQRNILDVCIDPRLNIFTRDNTNDGGGWDIRLSHIQQSGHYGYPSLYKNFTDESLPPLADYGGGSGCGGMYLHDLRWPEPYADALYTCDWGRSEVYRHNLPPNGATFDAHQEVFLKLPRPTDIDVDGSGRLYVSSWKNGKFAYDGPDVGFVAQVFPSGFTPKPFPDLTAATDRQLVAWLASPSAVHRQHSQLELLRRHASELRERNGRPTEITLAPGQPIPKSWPASNKALVELAVLAADPKSPLYGRVAAIFTLKQLAGTSSHSALVKLVDDAAVREFVLRALADRKSELDNVPLEPFVDALSDANPRVQAAALIGLGRLYDDGMCPSDSGSVSAERNARRADVANAILPLTARTAAVPKSDGDPWRQPDAGRVIPHLAVKTLASMAAIDECVAALNGPHRNGALRTLQSLHDPATVDSLFRVLGTSHDSGLRQEIWTALIRLYHREGDYKGGWWGTRPDTSGPYFQREAWTESDRIGDAIRVALAESDESLTAHIKQQLKRHVVRLDGITDDKIAAAMEPEKAIQLPGIDPNNPNLIGNLSYEDVFAQAMKATGDAKAGQALFRSQSCAGCHTFANGQQPKGPHLVDIGKRYKKQELIESIVDPSRKIAQGFDTWTFVMSSGQALTGFVVLESAETVTIRQTDGLSRELLQDEIDDRVKQPISMMPKGVVGNLTPEQLADLIAWLQTLH